MKNSDIRQMTDDQIVDEIEDMKEALFKLRLQEANGQLENTNAIRYARRDIARLKTILRERELAAQMASEEQ
jgi:large subunit ribosomal protein L29